MSEPQFEGDKLRQLRDAIQVEGKAMTQEQFAASLDYSRTYISRNEGAAQLTPTLRERLRDVYPDEYKQYFGDDEPSEVSVGLDFLDDPDWSELFDQANQVDLFFSEASLWRRSVEPLLDQLADRDPKVRIRAVLPDVLSRRVVRELQQRLGVDKPFVKRNIAEAYFDLLNRGVEVYVTTVAPRYALYRFGGRMVITMYNQRRHETRQVPTLQISRGDLYDWFLDDFETVIDQTALPTLARPLSRVEGLTTARRILTDGVDGHWTRPPRGKLLKAFSTIADGRVVDDSDHQAGVISSTGKHYVVEYDASKNAIVSNDGGSFFRGYLNYPMIAYLMKRRKLPRDKRVWSWFAGLNYHVLSRDHQRDYVAIEREILRKSGHDSSRDVERLNRYVADVYRAIGERNLARLPSNKLPKPEWAREYNGAMSSAD